MAMPYDFQTIAFPSISTGRYRFPIDLACQIAIQACQDASIQYPHLTEIRIICFDEITFQMYQAIGADKGLVVRDLPNGL
jgi:O-acetyl-ADP-ribose deacetylase (regulator of RNase III)